MPQIDPSCANARIQGPGAGRVKSHFHAAGLSHLPTPWRRKLPVSAATVQTDHTTISTVRHELRSYRPIGCWRTAGFVATVAVAAIGTSIFAGRSPPIGAHTWLRLPIQPR